MVASRRGMYSLMGHSPTFSKESATVGYSHYLYTLHRAVFHTNRLSPRWGNTSINFNIAPATTELSLL